MICKIVVVKISEEKTDCKKNVWSNNMQKMKQFRQHIRPYPELSHLCFIEAPNCTNTRNLSRDNKSSWGGEPPGESQNLGNHVVFFDFEPFPGGLFTEQHASCSF